MARLDPCGIPIDPDGATRPEGEATSSRRTNFATRSELLSERGDSRLHIEHVRLTHPFGFITGALPKLKQVPETEAHGLRCLHSRECPSNRSCRYECQARQPHNDTCSHITVAKLASHRRMRAPGVSRTIVCLPRDLGGDPDHSSVDIIRWYGRRKKLRAASGQRRWMQ